MHFSFSCKLFFFPYITDINPLLYFVFTHNTNTIFFLFPSTWRPCISATPSFLTIRTHHLQLQTQKFPNLIPPAATPHDHHRFSPIHHHSHLRFSTPVFLLQLDHNFAQASVFALLQSQLRSTIDCKHTRPSSFTTAAAFTQEPHSISNVLLATCTPAVHYSLHRPLPTFQPFSPTDSGELTQHL